MPEKRLFVFGTHIGYSLSPAICSAALREMGLDWHYSILDMPPGELPAAVTHLRGEDCVGANVTIPHKEAIIPLLDDLSDRVRLVHSANTVVKRDGRLVGENTDGIGFLEALAAAQFSLPGAHVLILGAGGAARGVAFALADAGVASITLLNRTEARAQALAAALQSRVPGLIVAAGRDQLPTPAGLIVNTLPPAATVDLAALPLAPEVLAFDLTYRSAVTPFLSAAAQAGAATMNGLAMLVYQAAASLKLWTGRVPDTAAMFAAAQDAISTHSELPRG